MTRDDDIASAATALGTVPSPQDQPRELVGLRSTVAQRARDMIAAVREVVALPV